jgi:isoleucyl-tRNA synthetase
MFQPVDAKVSFPAMEEQILDWWRAERIVERSLASNPQGPTFVFYEGPPTSNGRPGIHHVISRSFKDIILRYKAMRGYRIVGRREGWDTHGLPVEIEVEKELGFNGKPDIERYGIAAFNAKCKESVWRYIQEWRRLTERIAYWLDPDGYITYENPYIESEWQIFRQLWDAGLLFRDYKVTMHCPRCGTSLSDHEVSQGFREGVDDPSVWIKFTVQGPGGSGDSHPLAEELAGAALLAWTTTPWTLPANVALCVKPDAHYALVALGDERLILAAALVERVLGADAQVERTYLGSELVGLRYDNLFEGVPGAGDAVDWHSAYRVIADDFVSLDDGTGVVHIAPAYGDLEIGRKYGLPTLFSVDLSGLVLPEFNDLGFGGKFFKQADPDITRNLKERGLLLRSGRVSHSYPFCWRCGTALLYFAKRSWYIRTTARKERLIALNQTINWVPENIRDGRFGNWLENNIDWAVSRERYWGSPLPIWVSDDGEHAECIGSVAELETKVGRPLRDLDLHRPYVDELTWEAPNNHGTMRRIPDVADAWFDSGAMPLAQWHYPFENAQLFDIAHPADYICEAVDQTRGWLYTLHALSTLLYDKPAFKNVICLGHILDGEGQKMSKSRGNVVDPWQVVGETGVDALRWYLFTASPPGKERRFSIELVSESLRKFLLTLWNTYSFFVTYASLDRLTIDELQATLDKGQFDNPLDRWALASLNALVRDATAALDAYDVTGAARAIEEFVDALSNWYVRRSRRRFWKSEADADKRAAYATLYTCLLTVAKLAAPFAPFVSEAIYRNLSGLAADGRPQTAAAESVHLASWPAVNEALLDERLVADTATLLEAVSLGRAARKSAGLKVRQPLSELHVRGPNAAASEGLRRFEADLREELNVKAVRYLDAASTLVEYRFKPNLRVVGKKYGKQVPAITAALKALTGDEARKAAQLVEAKQPVPLALDGVSLELQPDELLLETSSPEGFAVAEGDGVLVALNTQLSPELRLEGLARDLVRNVQDARKNAGLAISDHIALFVGGDGAGALREALAAWGGYVRDETLADELVVGDAPAGAYQERVSLDEGEATIGIVKR